MSGVSISRIDVADAPSFRACLDAVAREGRFLALTEAPPLESMLSFVQENLRAGVPQVVAKENGVVVGWCDITPGWHQTLRHCGSVGMGVLLAYRGRGIGRQLLSECIALARPRGITRVELEARADNLPALKLYEGFGFAREGVKARGMRVGGVYQDTVVMGLLL